MQYRIRNMNTKVRAYIDATARKLCETPEGQRIARAWVELLRSILDAMQKNPRIDVNVTLDVGIDGIYSTGIQYAMHPDAQIELFTDAHNRQLHLELGLPTE